MRIVPPLPVVILPTMFVIQAPIHVKVGGTTNYVCDTQALIHVKVGGTTNYVCDTSTNTYEGM